MDKKDRNKTKLFNGVFIEKLIIGENCVHQFENRQICLKSSNFRKNILRRCILKLTHIHSLEWDGIEYNIKFGLINIIDKPSYFAQQLYLSLSEVFVEHNFGVPFNLSVIDCVIHLISKLQHLLDDLEHLYVEPKFVTLCDLVNDLL